MSIKRNVQKLCKRQLHRQLISIFIHSANQFSILLLQNKAKPLRKSSKSHFFLPLMLYLFVFLFDRYLLTIFILCLCPIVLALRLKNAIFRFPERKLQIENHNLVFSLFFFIYVLVLVFSYFPSIVESFCAFSKSISNHFIYHETTL